MKPIKASDIADGIKAISDQLSDQVSSAVTRKNKKTMKGIQSALRSGDFQEAQRLTRDLDVDKVLDDLRPVFVSFARSAALLGAGAVDSPSTSIWATGAPFPDVVDRTGPQQVAESVRGNLREIKRRMEQRVVDAARFQKGRAFRKAKPIDPDKLANDINRFLRGEIRRVVDAASNATGTRLSAFGMYHEARVRGILKYRIDAVLDERTTEICRNMNGRVFDVEPAYTFTHTVLGLTDPNAIKKMAPFPGLEDVQPVINDKTLQDWNLHTPPFHFLCRSVVTLIEAEQSVETSPVDYSLFDTEPWDRDTSRKYFFETTLVNTVRHVLGGKKNPLDTPENELTRWDIEALAAYDTAATAARTYTGGYYSTVNGALRSNSMVDYDKETFIETVRGLDEYLKRPEAILQEDTIVYRGLDNRALGERIASTLSVGKVFQDDGFVSTTVYKQVADNFSKTVTVKIIVPKGTPAARVEPFTKIDGEMEIVLGRGTQFRVIGSEQKGGTLEIRAVVIGQGEVLDPEDIGSASLPTLEMVQKQNQDTEDKFSWKINDLREVPLS